MARFQRWHMFNFSRNCHNFPKWIFRSHCHSVGVEWYLIIMNIFFCMCIDLLDVFLRSAHSCLQPIFKKFYLFIFGCAGLLLCASFLQLRRAGATLVAVLVFSLWLMASLVVEHGLQGVWASVVGARGLEWRLSSCGSCAQLPCGVCSLPVLVIVPMSSALAGGFLTAGPPGKSFSPFLIGQLMVFLIDLYEFFVYSEHESFVRYMHCEYFLSMACLFISGAK